MRTIEIGESDHECNAKMDGTEIVWTCWCGYERRLDTVEGTMQVTGNRAFSHSGVMLIGKEKQ